MSIVRSKQVSKTAIKKNYTSGEVWFEPIVQTRYSDRGLYICIQPWRESW